MTNVRMIVNGKEFQVNFRLLETIAKNISSDKKYEGLANALVGLGIPSLTATLLKDGILQAHYDEIWANGNLETRQELISADGFLENLSDDQAQDIIRMNDTAILKSVAKWSENLIQEEDEDNENEHEYARRISKEMVNSLMSHIISHPDSRVREEAAMNDFTPDPFIIPVRECIKLGVVPKYFSISAMTKDDVDFLANANMATLESIASNIEHISNEDIQNAVAKLLATSANPAVRLTLAGNRLAPHSILDQLSTDEDGDVAYAAQKSLDPSDDEDDDDDWDDDEWDDEELEDN